MRVNAEATAVLANAAASAGVRRLVYVSSIGVLGSVTVDAPFTEASPARPHNAYTESKLAGEMAARSAASRLEVVIIRLPLVYGSDVGANFLRLLRSVDRGWPLPFAAVRNKRSLVNVWNTCDFMVNVLRNPVAVGGTWIVSDGEDLSTPELIRRIGVAMRRRVHLLHVPISLLRLFGAAAGQGAQIAQLCGSLVVDPTKTRHDLSWSPGVTVDEALRRTVAWYLSDASAPGVSV
jgi:nucleoside-diphosphate-sugar epimerase